MPEQTRPVLEIRGLPGTTETLAYQDGGQFPVLATTPQGQLVAALRGGAGHLGLAGRLDVVRSLDMGRHWTPPAILADSDWDDRNPALGLSPTGTLVLAYHRQGGYDSEGNYHEELWAAPDAPIEVMVTRSVDGGVTWEPPRSLGVPVLHAGSPFGKIVALPDGTLLLAIYGRARQQLVGDRIGGIASSQNCSYIVRSRDDGRTWGDPSFIDVYDETGLLALPDGELLAFMRGNTPDDFLALTRSTDGGYTWSEPVPVTGKRQHPADLTLLSDGSILLSYGNRNPPYRIEGLVSRDGGRTWLDVVLAFSGPLYGYNVTAPRPNDLGYPSSVILRRGETNLGVTLYYYHPSLRRHENWKQGERGSFYQNQGYRAVAVTWSEDELLAALAPYR